MQLREHISTGSKIQSNFMVLTCYFFGVDGTFEYSHILSSNTPGIKKEVGMSGDEKCLHFPFWTGLKLSQTRRKRVPHPLDSEKQRWKRVRKANELLKMFTRSLE